MKTFKKLLAPTLLGSFALAGFTSCETTGDPTKGGYLGYSQEKNQQRRAELHDILREEENIGSDLKGERSRLQGQLKWKQDKLAALRRQREQEEFRRIDPDPGPGPAPGPGPGPVNDAEIASLESEIRLLKSKLAGLENQ